MGTQEEDQQLGRDKNQIHNPHDRFLKHTLGKIEHVQATLEGLLPTTIFDRLDLPTLKRDETSYIDGKLKQFFSDLVYSCQTKDDIPLKLAFLFEHKSAPPNYPHLQLLRYMLEIWERQAHTKQNLSLIIPILIYHGKEAWPKQDFEQYFDGNLDEEFRMYVPFFDFILADLQASSYTEINARFPSALVRISFRLMKSSRDEDLAQKLHATLEGLPELGKNEEVIAFFRTIIVYLSSVSQVNKEQIMQELEDLYITSDGSAIYRDSPAMAWILEGKAKAEAELKKQFESFKQQFKKEVEAEAQKKIGVALEEVKKKEAEAEKKEAEAEKKEAEAKKKEAEAKKKIELEKEKAILKLIDANIPKVTIAGVWGMSIKELETYLLSIKKKKEDKDNSNSA